jgi:NTP pyrophosphatase (non-canonical NTP hydrolase)
MKMLENQLVKDLVDVFGLENQYTCCIEEMSELTQVLTKLLRKDSIHSIHKLTQTAKYKLNEEISHVKFTIDVLCQLINLDEQINENYLLVKEKVAKRLEREKESVWYKVEHENKFL